MDLVRAVGQDGDDTDGWDGYPGTTGSRRVDAGTAR